MADVRKGVQVVDAFRSTLTFPDATGFEMAETAGSLVILSGNDVVALYAAGAWKSAEYTGASLPFSPEAGS